MPFALRATQRFFKFPLIGSTIKLVLSPSARTVEPCTYLLIINTRGLGTIQLDHHSLLELTDWLCSHPFGLISPTYCLSPTITVTKVAFALRRVNPDPGLHKWTLASASL
jgi:hypothetical protein